MSAVSLASFSGSLSYWFAKKVLTKGEREKDEEGERGGGGQLLPFSVLRVVLTRLSFCHLQQLCQQQHVQRRGSLWQSGILDFCLLQIGLDKML